MNARSELLCLEQSEVDFKAYGPRPNIGLMWALAVSWKPTKQHSTHDY